MQQKIETLELSVRSINCLKQEQIYYIDDLIVLHELDLRRIPNMGEKSINEIKQQLEKIGLSLGMNVYHNINDESLYIKEESEINIWLDSIANIELKQAELNNFLFCAIDNLSVRSRNTINSELTSYNNIIEFLKHLFSLQSVLVLPNIGKISELEIKTFLADIRQEIKHLYKSKKIAISTASDLMEYMNIPQCLKDKYRENHPDNEISFFAIVNLVIKDNLSKKELEILKYRKDYWDKEQVTLERLGEKLGVTRERIRQIEVKADSKLWSNIKALSIYAPLVNLKQRYEFYGDFIDNVAIINERDKTYFSDNFLYRVLAIFLKGDYQLVIENKDKYRFLINNNINNTFDFKGFVDKVNTLISKSVTDYKLDFKGLLYPYLKPKNNDIDLAEIESVCEDLLNVEFNIVLDIDNQIPIKGRKKKSIEAYAEEILKGFNLPTHLDEIYNKIQEKCPELNPSKRSIGNAFVGNNTFIFFDRNSTYGLKVWEGELTQNSNLIHIVKPNKTDNNRSGVKVWLENDRVIVKGGTIINIVLEYLKQFEEPKHINDIFAEVEKWRDTRKHKLVSNLKINNRDFIFYKNGLIGIANERAN